MTQHKKPVPQPSTPDQTVQGEGDYQAARRYDKNVEKFVADHSDDIDGMAEDASSALDTPEGDELRDAERAGKSKARG